MVALSTVLEASDYGGHMSMWNDRIGLLFCLLFPVQVGATPFHPILFTFFGAV